MITSVYIDTDELVFQLHSVSDDAQKALEWVRSFRDTLMFGARIANPLPFAMECMAMSEGFSASGVLGKLRAAARKRLNDEGIEATPESIDAEISRTQGADAVREIIAKIERANSLKAEIRRRKFTADAPHREAGDERQHHSDVELLESGTSANTYDQEATKESTKALDKAGAGEVTPESVSAKPSPALSVLSFGEFGNIKMNNTQYCKLCERFSFADTVIEEADQYFEAQPAKKKKYKNHYAMLLNWCKRRETESKPKQGYMTSDDISKKNYEESKARLEAMFSKGRKTA